MEDQLFARIVEAAGMTAKVGSVPAVVVIVAVTAVVIVAREGHLAGTLDAAAMTVIV